MRSSRRPGTAESDQSYFAARGMRSGSAWRSPPIPDLLLDGNVSAASPNGYTDHLSLPPSPISPRCLTRPGLARSSASYCSSSSSSSKYSDMLYANTHFSRGSGLLVADQEQASPRCNSREDEDIEELIAAAESGFNLRSSTVKSDSSVPSRTSSIIATPPSPAAAAVAAVTSSPSYMAGPGALTKVATVPIASATSCKSASPKRTGLVKMIGHPFRSTRRSSKGSAASAAAASAAAGLVAHAPLSTSLTGSQSPQVAGTNSSVASYRSSWTASRDPFHEFDRASDCGSTRSSTLDNFSKKVKSRTKLPFAFIGHQKTQSPTMSAATPMDLDRFNTFPRMAGAAARESMESSCSVTALWHQQADLETPPMSASSASTTFGIEPDAVSPYLGPMHGPSETPSPRLRRVSRFPLGGSQGKGKHRKSQSIQSIWYSRDKRVEEQDWELTLQQAADKASWESSISHRPRSRDREIGPQQSWPRRRGHSSNGIRTLDELELQVSSLSRATAIAGSVPKRPTLPLRSVSSSTLPHMSRIDSHYSSLFQGMASGFPQDEKDESEIDTVQSDGAGLLHGVESDDDCIPLQLDSSSEGWANQVRNGSSYLMRRASSHGVHFSLPAWNGLGIVPAANGANEDCDEFTRRISRSLIIPDVPEAVSPDSSSDSEELNTSLTGRQRSSTIKAGLTLDASSGPVPLAYDKAMGGEMTTLDALLKNHETGQALDIQEASMWIR